MTNAEARLRELKIELPAVQKAAGTYVRAVRTANLLFTAWYASGLATLNTWRA